MKRPAWLVVPITLAMLAAPAMAEDAAFAKRWPLSVEREDSGVYRVVLDASVYETAIDPALRDVSVMDADGDLQPATLVAHRSLDDTAASTVELPWFPIPPAPASAASQRWRVVTRTGPDARVQQVETEVLEAGTRAPETTDLLIDASQAGAALTWIELDWPPQAEPIDARFVVEHSNDLDDWQPDGTTARLIDLANQGMRIERRRIELSRAGSAPYLRLRHAGGQRPLRISAVRGGLASPLSPPDRQWVELQGRVVEEDGQASVVFTSPGRYPVSAVQVWPRPNTAQRWQLQSRDRDGDRWLTHDTGTVAYRLRDAQGESHSPAITLRSPTRHTQWRLTSDGRIDEAPEIRLGYTPETLVFLSRGEKPYSLVAGSARSYRADAPMDDMLAAQRQRYGADWVASEARLGVPAALAGAAALEPGREPRRYSHWVMWSILVLGSLLVAWLAFGLLRAPRRGQ
ncbi:DUF3999 family protein [Alkalisalibacterium limincola]|uniref:DUF3999 domain-containing protein n=1 Tax=Alkalisalibacterium limincola TaxID=2699169 RepID=A0A5C8KW67_9GAMM|nr:DUF3999 family protein [Alkalisalibacterium limincola]TXK64338.1 DUF3999 domain-containing protein [Alkalisalibacterium limincola]